MTPELMEAGARTREEAEKRKASAVLSGDRAASYSRVVVPGELDVAHGAILYLDDITVSFDGFKALNALSLNISAGELRCIIGPNGAGKPSPRPAAWPRCASLAKCSAPAASCPIRRPVP